MSDRSRFRPLVTYLAILLLFSSIGYTFVILSGHLGGARGTYVLQLMWSPGIAAVLTLLVLRRPLGELGWKWGAWKWQVQAWLVPLLYTAIAYGIIWTSGLGGAPNPDYIKNASETVGLHIPPGAAAALLIALTGTIGMTRIAGSLGEEIGWRGFLVPELYRLTRGNFTATGLISGAIWGLWHTPILLFADYNNPGVPRWYSLLNFAILVLSGGVIFAWFRLRSGSLWTGVLLHTSHNLYIQAIFTPLTIRSGHANYFIDEFGAAVPVISALFAVYFWTRRHELQLALSEVQTIPVASAA